VRNLVADDFCHGDDKNSAIEGNRRIKDAIRQLSNSDPFELTRASQFHLQVPLNRRL
jgi:hypothetical protein